MFKIPLTALAPCVTPIAPSMISIRSTFSKLIWVKSILVPKPVSLTMGILSTKTLKYCESKPNNEAEDLPVCEFEVTFMFKY